MASTCTSSTSNRVSECASLTTNTIDGIKDKFSSWNYVNKKVNDGMAQHLNLRRDSAFDNESYFNLGGSLIDLLALTEMMSGTDCIQGTRSVFDIESVEIFKFVSAGIRSFIESGFEYELDTKHWIHCTSRVRSLDLVYLDDRSNPSKINPAFRGTEPSLVRSQEFLDTKRKIERETRTVDTNQDVITIGGKLKTKLIVDLISKRLIFCNYNRTMRLLDYMLSVQQSVDVRKNTLEWILRMSVR